MISPNPTQSDSLSTENTYAERRIPQNTITKRKRIVQISNVSNKAIGIKGSLGDLGNPFSKCRWIAEDSSNKNHSIMFVQFWGFTAAE